MFSPFDGSCARLKICIGCLYIWGVSRKVWTNKIWWKIRMCHPQIKGLCFVINSTGYCSTSFEWFGFVCFCCSTWRCRSNVTLVVRCPAQVCSIMEQSKLRWNATSRNTKQSLQPTGWKLDQSRSFHGFCKKLQLLFITSICIQQKIMADVEVVHITNILFSENTILAFSVLWDNLLTHRCSSWQNQWHIPPMTWKCKAPLKKKDLIWIWTGNRHE